MSFRHSEIITCLAKLKSCGLSFRGHSLQEWLWNDIFISLRSFPDGMIWNDNCPHPTGMTGMALEWLDWAQNDGMRRPPKRSFEFPSLSFLPHPVIPASSGNAVTMGISLEWRRNDSGRGTKLRYFPLTKRRNLLQLSWKYPLHRIPPPHPPPHTTNAQMESVTFYMVHPIV